MLNVISRVAIVGAFAALLWSVSTSVLELRASHASPSGFLASATKTRQSSSFGNLAPLPPTPSVDDRRVALGRELFHDKRLSSGNEVSCASCHDLQRGGADGLQFSVGLKGRRGSANAPTVFNSSLNFSQFWDGRAHTLEDQIDGPIHDPKEMGSSWPEIVAKLRQDKDFRQRFEESYGALTAEGIADAIVEFEKTLLTPDSKFDQFLNGDKSAFNEIELEGFRKFESNGCIACHQGVNVGGNMYQRLGIANDYFRERGGSYPSDLGRYNVTKREADKHMFRVPSLRNVALTAPYFHDGSVPTLEEAIRKMARYQLGRPLSERDVIEISAFLKTMTGKLPATTTARGVANASGH